MAWVIFKGGEIHIPKVLFETKSRGETEFGTVFEWCSRGTSKGLDETEESTRKLTGH